MAFEQRDLPILSETLWDFADAVSGHVLPRKRRLWISSIAPDSDGIIRWIPSQKKETPMSDLGILVTLRDLEAYRGPTADISRRNIYTVARVGGTALHHIFDTARGKNLYLSDQAMNGISKTTLAIHGRLEQEFVPIASKSGADKQARYLLARTAAILLEGPGPEAGGV